MPSSTIAKATLGWMPTITVVAPRSLAISAMLLNVREPNESSSCSGDGASFKGAAIRGLGVLNTATGGAYNTYLSRNADSAYAHDRNTLDEYGSHWAGPFVATNHGCQHSAVDLLNAAP